MLYERAKGGTHTEDQPGWAPVEKTMFTLTKSNGSSGEGHTNDGKFTLKANQVASFEFTQNDLTTKEYRAEEINNPSDHVSSVECRISEIDLSEDHHATPLEPKSAYDTGKIELSPTTKVEVEFENALEDVDPDVLAISGSKELKVYESLANDLYSFPGDGTVTQVTYEYVIAEQAGSDENIEYDASPATVKVTVTKSASNTLKADIAYSKAGIAGNNVFVNTYTELEPEPEPEEPLPDTGDDPKDPEDPKDPKPDGPLASTGDKAPIVILVAAMALAAAAIALALRMRSANS